MTTRDPVHPSVTVAGITDDDIRVHAIAAPTASDDFGTVAVRVGYGLDLYLTTSGATALRDRLTTVLDAMTAPRVVVDTDTGETLTQPLPLADATALVAATTGRNVHVQAVTR